MAEEIIKFDLVGKFAHFRKFYGNNTALTYSLPPRTTITGILAAILGLQSEKFDAETNYDEDFQSDKLDIGIFLASPIKKQFFRVNTLKVEEDQDFRGRKGHTQTPFEIILNQNFPDNIRYTIYLHNKNFKYYDELKQRILSKSPVYSISLGLANFLAYIENPEILIAKKYKVKNKKCSLYSAVNSMDVEEISWLSEPDLEEVFKAKEDNFLEQDVIPADFSNDRRTIKFNDIIFSIKAKPFEVIISGEIYEMENGQFIQFLN